MGEKDQDATTTLARSTRSSGTTDSGRSPSCYFSDDLLIQILSRLPPKSLLRFMCVSKSWRNLISNDLPSSPVSGLFYTSCSNFDGGDQINGYAHLSGCCGVDCKEAIETWGASVRTSDVNLIEITYCNGLFLLYNEKDVLAAYHVCNPATNQCVAVPEPPYPHVMPSFWTTSALAFDPHDSPHYKIVRLVASLCDAAQVYIFCSKESRWIECNVCVGDACEYMDDKLFDRYSVFMNGALHWISSDSLCSFDVEKLCVRGVDLPKERLSRWPQFVGKSEGHLFHACCNHLQIQIWMLEDFERGEWVLKHAIRTESIVKHPAAIPIPGHPRAFPLAFHPDLEVLFIETEGKILSYHFGSKRDVNERLEEVCTLEIDKCVPSAFPYSRCLSAVDGCCN